MGNRIETIQTVDTSGRKVLMFVTPPRVTSMWGAGQLRYAKEDGWVGIQLDGETRVDEYPVEHVALEPVFAGEVN